MVTYKVASIENIDYEKLVSSIDAKYIQFITRETVYNEACITDVLDNLDEKKSICINGKISDICSYVFETNILKNKQLIMKSDYYKKLELIAYIRKYSKVENIKIDFNSNNILEDNFEHFQLSYTKEWYEEFFDFNEKYGEDKELILYIMVTQFLHNINHKNKHVCEVYSYLEKCKSILNDIDDEMILNIPKKYEYMKEIKNLNYVFMKIKHGDFYADRIKDKIYEVEIELIEYDHYNKGLVFESSVEEIFSKRDCNLYVVVENSKKDENICEIIEKSRYADINYFDKCLYKKRTFSFFIKNELLKDKKNTIKIIGKYDGKEEVYKLVTKRFTTKISSVVKGSYWVYKKDKLMNFDNENNSIIVSKTNKINHICKEIKLLYNMTHGKNHSISMIYMRMIYWLTKWFFKHKNIWITFDKPFKAGDCGEYIYKYVRNQHDGVDIRFVINEKYKDAARLKNEGYAPLLFGTLKQRLYYLNASIVLTTHGVVHNYNAFNTRQIVFVQDLINADAMCIQHGLSVQELAFEENRVYNNIKRYFCASKYEIKNLSQVQYDYSKENLKLTGIPRYDGLINKKERVILIAPTWRQYIVMPSKVGEARPYYDGFKQTDYYKIYDKLLRDKKMIDTAKKYGYKIKYLLHPVISEQKRDYAGYDENVEIIAAIDANYEKLLTTSSLMITDYSGTQFDFAYMRKPVLYYHPEKLPPHYKEGGFFYDTMAFGEICKEQKKLVDTLCFYMENECKLKDEYRFRENDFFEYDDLNSCKRIYEEVLEYQKARP